MKILAKETLKIISEKVDIDILVEQQNRVAVQIFVAKIYLYIELGDVVVSIKENNINTVFHSDLQIQTSNLSNHRSQIINV